MLLLFCGAAFLLRSVFAWNKVFGLGFVRFAETDAWYHLRLVDGLLHHFPSPLTYDPYLKFPGGQNVNVAPGLDWLIAGLSLLLGGGTPSSSLVEWVAALVPPTLGALMVIPVYQLGRAMFSARAGLFAAALIALLPGPWLGRSMLGFVDHHVGEALFSTVTLMLVVWATREPRDGWLGRAALSGVGLAAYLSMWSGGALFVLALAAGLWVHLVVAHVRGDSDASHAAATFVVATVTAACLVAPLLRNFVFVRYHLIALVGGAVSVVALGGLSAYMRRRGLRHLWYPVASAVLLAGLTGLLTMAAPGVTGALVGQMGRLAGASTSTVGEAAPLMASNPWWPVFLFASFGLALPVALLALVPAVRAALVGGRLGPVLLVVWFVVALGAMVGQVRFAYYVAMPVAVLAGVACDRVLDRWPRRQNLAFLLIILLLFVPIAQLARAQAIGPSEPDDDWFEALSWMRANTPDPFGRADAYFDDDSGRSEARPYPYPDGAYGVLSWWDAGYWIVRIARRIPNANPTQSNAGEVAGVLLATDEATARTRLDALGTRYVVASYDMPARPHGHPPGYFPAMSLAAGLDERVFVETFYERGASGSLVPKTLYYPAYYRTMVTRLYVYGGRRIDERDSAYVVVFSESEELAGARRKIIESLEPAASYAEAAQIAERLGAEHARVVGVDPFRTCVPLEALDTLHFVHRSPTADDRAPAEAAIDGQMWPTLVQIFEYRPDEPQPASE